MSARQKRRLKPKKNGGRPHSQPINFDESLTWRIFRIMSEFTDGYEFVSRLTRPVTFFGSARQGSSTKYYGASYELAKRLGRHGFTIVTGGGPGVMEAANKGASQVGADSIGLNIELPNEQRTNKYVKRGMGFYYFFSRKTMLSVSAQAYVFFPGGYGTMDEFFTICTLIQTKKIEKRPLILYGSAFWKPLTKFILEKMLKDRSISDADMRLFTIVDTVTAAEKLVVASKHRKYTSM